MNQRLKPSAGRRARLAMRAAALSVLMAATTGAQEIDALYLNDGSVLKGTIVRVTDGDYLVYSPLGELGVERSRVLYAAARESTPPVIAETHVFIGGTTETFTVWDRAVPPQPREGPGRESFRFLSPGTAASLVNENGDEIRFESKSVGVNSIVTVKYADLPADTARIQVTAWRFDLLTATDNDRLVFEQHYTLEREGRARVIVKYPREWRIVEISPPAETQLSGLVLWRKDLMRQQQFAPRIVFQPRK